jgi:hypothetical protein
MTEEERLHREYEKLLRERIEELEADLRKMALDYLAAQGQAAEAYQAQLATEAKLDLSEGALDVASKSWGECQRILEQTEAKLAKCQALMHAGFAEYKRRLTRAVKALELADAALSGANMNMIVVEREVKATIAELEGELDD